MKRKLNLTVERNSGSSISRFDPGLFCSKVIAKGDFFEYICKIVLTFLNIYVK